jgi:large subunit ribosomal protein L4e
MFAPTKIWRRWHRHVNLKQKRNAVTSALAASAVPSLVIARGHRIDNVPEIPLVLDNLEKTERTKDLIEILKRFGAYEDVERVKDSKTLRAGRGKLRNRRYTMRRGPLIVYEEQNAPITKAFRNVPGVDLLNVHRLNLLNLAPGGTLGRFIIWSSQAFRALDTVFAEEKAGFTIPRPMLTNSDISEIIASDAIQSVLRPVREVKSHAKKTNPLKNNETLAKLDPEKAKRRIALKASKQ